MNVIITGRGVKITKPIKDKVNKMIAKHSNFLETATKIDVELKEGIAHSGVDTDLRVEITVTMPKALIRVEETGSDFYAIIDLIDPILRRRLVRYSDMKNIWSGEMSWRTVEKDKYTEEMDEIDEDLYAEGAYIPPKITRHKQYSQNSPMHPAEAIERMELLGHEAFLFKNIQNNTYSMVYKRSDGSYGLVEPKEG